MLMYVKSKAGGLVDPGRNRNVRVAVAVLGVMLCVVGTTTCRSAANSVPPELEKAKAAYLRAGYCWEAAGLAPRRRYRPIRTQRPGLLQHLKGAIGNGSAFRL